VNRLRRAIILMMLIAGVGIVLMTVSQLAVQNALPQNAVITANVRVTAVLGRPTPIAPFGPLDPAIIPALQSTPGNKPFAVLPSVQPIGIYLPANTPVPQLPTITPSATLTFTPSPTVPTSTMTVTPSRTPTITPTPTKPMTPTPFPTDMPVEDIGIQEILNLHWTPNPTLVPRNCAPHGFPVTGVLTQRFNTYHTGIDLGVDIGTPVLATQSGQVIFAGWSAIGYGWLVIIQNDQYITYYAHNSAFKVIQYEYVKTGDIISYSGSSGNSSGPHVHYEARIDNFPVDPLTFDLRGLHSC
jgi:murein DD-endopeptidase MepM/ murein hydrolase activator NlpD